VEPEAAEGPFFNHVLELLTLNQRYRTSQLPADAPDTPLSSKY
jgi:hypothetical protein